MMMDMDSNGHLYIGASYSMQAFKVSDYSFNFTTSFVIIIDVLAINENKLSKNLPPSFGDDHFSS